MVAGSGRGETGFIVACLSCLEPVGHVQTGRESSCHDA